MLYPAWSHILYHLCCPSTILNKDGILCVENCNLLQFNAPRGCPLEHQQLGSFGAQYWYNINSNKIDYDFACWLESNVGYTSSNWLNNASTSRIFCWMT